MSPLRDSHRIYIASFGRSRTHQRQDVHLLAPLSWFYPPLSRSQSNLSPTCAIKPSDRVTAKSELPKKPVDREEEWKMDIGAKRKQSEMTRRDIWWTQERITDRMMKLLPAENERNVHCIFNCGATLFANRILEKRPKERLVIFGGKHSASWREHDPRHNSVLPLEGNTVRFGGRSLFQFIVAQKQERLWMHNSLRNSSVYTTTHQQWLDLFGPPTSNRLALRYRDCQAPSVSTDDGALTVFGVVSNSFKFARQSLLCLLHVMLDYHLNITNDNIFHWPNVRFVLFLPAREYCMLKSAEIPYYGNTRLSQHWWRILFSLLFDVQLITEFGSEVDGGINGIPLIHFKNQYERKMHVSIDTNFEHQVSTGRMYPLMFTPKFGLPLARPTACEGSAQPEWSLIKLLYFWQEFLNFNAKNSPRHMPKVGPHSTAILRDLLAFYFGSRYATQMLLEAGLDCVAHKPLMHFTFGEAVVVFERLNLEAFLEKPPSQNDTTIQQMFEHWYSMFITRYSIYQ